MNSRGFREYMSARSPQQDEQAADLLTTATLPALAALPQSDAATSPAAKRPLSLLRWVSITSPMTVFFWVPAAGSVEDQKKSPDSKGVRAFVLLLQAILFAVARIELVSNLASHLLPSVRRNRSVRHNCQFLFRKFGNRVRLPSQRIEDEGSTQGPMIAGLH